MGFFFNFLKSVILWGILGAILGAIVGFALVFGRLATLGGQDIWAWLQTGNPRTIFILFFSITMPCISFGVLAAVWFAINQFRLAAASEPEVAE